MKWSQEKITTMAVEQKLTIQTLLLPLVTNDVAKRRIKKNEQLNNNCCEFELFWTAVFHFFYSGYHLLHFLWTSQTHFFGLGDVKSLWPICIEGTCVYCLARRDNLTKEGFSEADTKTQSTREDKLHSNRINENRLHLTCLPVTSSAFGYIGCLRRNSMIESAVWDF